MQSLLNLVAKKDRYKILTFPTHERTQSNLNCVNADFYLYNQTPHVKNWDNKYAQMPQNHFSLPDSYFPIGINFDFVLSQSRFVQFEIAYRFSKQLQIPLIHWEHTWCTKNLTEDRKEYMKNMKGDVNVYIGREQAKSWGEYTPFIIRHCVDSDMFDYNDSERDNHILTVCNDYINRDYVLGFSQYLEATKELPVCPVGDTPRLSEPAKDVNDLVNYYQKSRIFLNTSIESPIPTSLLEAMSCGCAIVSFNNCDIPYYIEHGYNGLLVNNVEDMRKYLKILLKDKDLATFLGKNARETVLLKCSKETFTQSWNSLFEKIINSELRKKNES